MHVPGRPESGIYQKDCLDNSRNNAVNKTLLLVLPFLSSVGE